MYADGGKFKGELREYEDRVMYIWVEVRRTVKL